MRDEIAELRVDMREVLAIVNASRGGLWVGRLFLGTMGGAVAYVADHFLRR